MMFQAVLSNRDHPEYGVATIPFPIPPRPVCVLHRAVGGAGDWQCSQSGLHDSGDR